MHHNSLQRDIIFSYFGVKTQYVKYFACMANTKRTRNLVLKQGVKICSLYVQCSWILDFNYSDVWSVVLL